jgi:hypothetical protein
MAESHCLYVQSLVLIDITRREKKYSKISWLLNKYRNIAIKSVQWV